MKISVVIPCHNARETIAAALLSVAAQDLAAHEIILVDDSSSDGSVEAARASGVLFELVEVSVRNAGAARNAGIARASGDWVAFLDADDVWLPHHLEQAMALLSRGQEVAWMANHCFSRGGRHEPLPVGMRHRLLESCGGLSGAQWVMLQRGGFHFGHSTVVYRRERVLEVGGFDTAYQRQEDLDLWLRVVDGKTWAYGAKVAAVYRVDTPGSLTKDPLLCEFFYLRAWLKNRAVAPDVTAKLIAGSARRLMGLSFVDGTRADFRAASPLARPHLPRSLRAFYALAPLARPLFRGAIRLKRRWVEQRGPRNQSQKAEV